MDYDCISVDYCIGCHRARVALPIRERQEMALKLISMRLRVRKAAYVNVAEDFAQLSGLNISTTTMSNWYGGRYYLITLSLPANATNEQKKTFYGMAILAEAIQFPFKE